MYKAADLERGFSLNKIILYVHGFSIKEDTLEVIRIVKDFIVRSNGVLNIEMTKDLFEHCKVSLTRYQCYLEENRKSREEEESHKQAKILEVNQRLSWVAKKSLAAEHHSCRKLYWRRECKIGKPYESQNHRS